jgi:hypothetical protein
MAVGAETMSGSARSQQCSLVRTVRTVVRTVRTFPAAAALLLSGCMPTVMHGPSVEPGPRMQAAVVATRTLPFDGESGDMGAVVLGGFQYGWLFDGTAVQASVQAPLWPALELFETAAAADLYVQPSRSKAAGVGVMASRVLVMPYGQIELLETGDGGSVYTTQAVGRVSDGSNPEYYWFPAVALRETRGDGWSGFILQLSGALSLAERPVQWGAALGVVVDFGMGDAH